MSYVIVWTDGAENSFSENLEYLNNEWGQSVVIDFVIRVKDALNTISLSPDLFPLAISKKNIHKCVITPQITLYYKIIDDTIIQLQIFWNVYQNPKRLKL